METTGSRNLTKRDLVQHVSIAYAEFAVEYEGLPIQPLDRAFAFSNGRHIVESGHYRATTSLTGVDWDSVARRAKRQLPMWIKAVKRNDPDLAGRAARQQGR